MKFVLYIYVLGQFLKYTDHIQSKFMDSTTSSYPNTCNSLRHKHLYTYDPFHLTLAPTYYSKTSHRRRTAYSVIQCMDSYDDHYSFGRANVCFDRSLALCFSQIETGFINCHLRGYLYSWVCVCVHVFCTTMMLWTLLVLTLITYIQCSGLVYQFYCALINVKSYMYTFIKWCVIRYYTKARHTFLRKQMMRFMVVTRSVLNLLL